MKKTRKAPRAGPSPPGKRRSPRGRRETAAFAAALALLVLTLFVYAPVAGFGFVDLDDGRYILNNPMVLKGITAEGLAWSVGTMHQANWHPLTWVAHMLDARLYGTRGGGHHLSSLLLHLANALLLLFLLRRMTGKLWPSFLVAALFAVHPLHVESVAWVSERKDVLSTFFGLLALAAYLHYLRRPVMARLAAAGVFLLLGLAAKPMLVTFPLLLLLLDYWPLGRVAGSAPGGERPLGLLLEKAPLLILSAASSVITLVAQGKGGALADMQFFTAARRVSNALESTIRYLQDMVLPVGLAAFYPLTREGPPAWLMFFFLFVLAGISMAAALQARRRPWFLVGWFWYLIALLPVIGLVRIGLQARADRYTYLPLVGIFLVPAWGDAELFSRRRWARRAVAAAAGAVLLTLAGAARIQAGYWRDSFTLFGHALAVTRGNWAAHFSLGNALLREGRDEEARIQFEEAVSLRPDFAQGYNNLGKIHLDRHDPDGAIAHFQRALTLKPDFVLAHANLGAALHRLRRFEEATGHYRRAIELDPYEPRAYVNFGLTLEKLGRREEAAAIFRKALDLRPGDAQARAHLEALAPSSR